MAHNRKICRCPYCGSESARIHSRYEKSFQDLPIMGKKTKVVIENRKFFCGNPDCGFTTFAERFDFLAQKGKKTKRLIEKIVDISLNTIRILKLYPGMALFPIKAPLNRLEAICSRSVTAFTC